MTTVWQRLRDPDEPELVLGVDVGGTKTAALLVDRHDAVLAEVSAPTRRDALPTGIVALADEALAAAGLGRDALDAVGIGLPGHVDATTGIVRMAVNVDRGAQPIAALVAEALDAPTFIEHDARAAARWIAELDAGAHRALAYVSVGTGISAGIVLDGRVLTGARGMAGEIGHVVALPDGPLCACGLHGCLEAVASGPAIAAASGATTAIQAFAAAAAGDPRARAAIDGAAAHLARAVRGLVLGFGLDLVVVGGGVSRAGDAFMQPVLEAIARERDESIVVRAHVGEDVVRRRPADPDTATWGAVTVARTGLRDRTDARTGGEEVGRRDVTTPTR